MKNKGGHKSKMIYLDNAATTAVKPEVFEAMKPYFLEEYANPSSVYGFAQKSARAVDEARKQIADLLHAKQNEIYFTAGGSESDNWAIKVIADMRKEKGKHIITSKIEHHAVLHTCEYLEKQGYEITYLEVDENGLIDVEKLKAVIRPDTILISIMFANNEIGSIQPISEIGKIAKEHNIVFHTDAVQAFGHVPIDVEAMNIDALSASGHKFHGPKGVGFMYLRSNIKIQPLIHGGSQERGKRAGTINVPGIVGMGKALSISQKNMTANAQKTAALRDELQARLVLLGGIRVNGDQENRLPGHLHVSVENANTSLLLMRLDMEGIAVSAGSACTSGSIERSHVIRAMELASENQADIRFSLSENNTIEEINAACEAVRRILKR